MNLKPGTALSIEITQSGSGFTIQPKLRIGKVAEKKLGSPTTVADEAALWMAIEDLAQDKLARLGLEATG